MQPRLPRATAMGAHLVQFYEQDSFLVDEVTRFIGEGLKAGEAGVVIATRRYIQAIQSGLSAHLARRGTRSAKSVARSNASKKGKASGPYIALEAEEALSRVLVDGWPDERRFREFIGGAIAKGALAGNGRVRAFGEMVALLWQAGKRDAAIRMEDLWNQLAKRHRFSLFCAYPMSAFANAEDGKRLLAVCNAHTHVHPAESFSRPTSTEALNRMIVQLQHQAAALHGEVARRAELEKSLRRRETELCDFLESAAEADRAATLMKRIVDDLLDVLRMTSGRMELKRETLLLGNVVERAIELARPLIDEKGHQSTVDVPPEGIWLHGDVLRLAQVLANLLNNAAKSTERGGRIVLTALREGPQEA